MFIPYQDVNPTNSTPYVTISLIVLNGLVFVGQLAYDFDGGMGLSAFQFGFRPASLIHPGSDIPGASPFITLFLSMFMHGGILHIVGNMLFLWIYGDNVEDTMGHGFFLAFYLMGGIVATLTHAFFNMDSVIPTIGASGAVAAVLGAYLVLFPHAKVKTFIWVFIFFMTTIYVPAWLLIGIFVLTNLFWGAVSLAGPDGPGVAWFAHLGGLAFGLLLAIPFKSRLRHAHRIHSRFNHWPSEWRI
ncbi:MAG: rhomboid family intramembrane serine protease [Candidatus Coatesbacteria bacterium]|nr:rhomboid family intramembrane serine protease [Candidatus Coatesbacteria bacterium]